MQENIREQCDYNFGLKRDILRTWREYQENQHRNRQMSRSKFLARMESIGICLSKVKYKYNYW